MKSTDRSGKTLLNIGDWEVQRLGDLISLEYGTGLSEALRIDGEFPVYGSNGQVGKHNNFLVRGPGIIVGRKGTIGAVIWSYISFWPIDTTYYVNPRKNHDLRWYYWQLLSLPIARMDSSTGIPGLNRNTVYELRVHIPPPSEQHLIANILDTLDTQIQQTEQIIAKLKQVKLGLLHDLLTRGIDENGDVRDPVAHPEEFKKTVLGKVPQKWQVSTLGDVVLSNGGFIQTGPFGSQLHAHEYVREGIPVIMPQDILGERINRSQIAYITPTKAETLARHRVEFNDVIFGRRGDLSRCAFVDISEIGSICGTGCLLVRPPNWIIDRRWLAATYRHYRSQQQMQVQAVGSTMVNLNTTLLAKLVIAVPPLIEQKAIMDKIAAFTDDISIEEADLAKLKQIKKGLMHDLLTGHVRVTQLIAEREQLSI